MTNPHSMADAPRLSGNSNQIITIEKTIVGSAEEAWRLWTVPTKLTTWLTSAANVELKVGELYELFWEPDHPERNSTIGCRILELSSQRMISFQWKGPVPFADIMNTEPLPTLVRVTFLESTTGKTTIRLEHLGWKSGSRWEQARKWQEKAWVEAFSNL